MGPISSSFPSPSYFAGQASGLAGRSSGPSEGATPGTAANDEAAPAAAAQNGIELDEAELKLLSELKSRDREVRAHEAAHQAVGGQYAGAMSFTYQRGPDGAQYAVGGEVSIDISPVNGDPQATIEKMRVVRAAAMAPAEPSGQDRAVAAQAMQIMLQAQSELAAQAGQGSSEPTARVDSENSSGDAPGNASAATDNLPRGRSRADQQAINTYQSVAGLS